MGPICQPDIQHFSPLSPHQARRPPFTLYPRRIYPSPYLTPRLRWIFELAQAPRRARKARRPCSHRLERPYRHLLACKREMSEVADGRWCLRLFPAVCECGYVKKLLCTGHLIKHRYVLTGCEDACTKGSWTPPPETHRLRRLKNLHAQEPAEETCERLAGWREKS